ncbi:GGDEF domain-containing protein [Microbulbifer sp. OS29]|uniref:diguanylate cyclase n=1 Tax=Microbulbifer okhotskensis TaxID=2926617 RepID=A0A9X2J438_9GAMM|nr:GGDEF domain-containing protein [Microbulbifer okhotskensis]MCO1333703.1 GGDEF domain-containing protein [Microbulbifer okhotskensis]
MPSYLQWLRFIWLPGILLALLAAQYLPWIDLTSLYSVQLPVLLLVMALMLSLGFRSSRVALASLLIMLIYVAAVLQFLPNLNTDLPLYLSIAAVNLVLFACSRDRSLFSFFGFLWLSGLIAESVGLAMLLECCAPLRMIFPLETLPEWLVGFLPRIFSLPQLVSCVSAVGAFALLFLYPGPTAMGLFSCNLLLLFAVWINLPVEFIGTVAAVLLLTSLLGASYELAFRDELTGVRSRRAFRYQMLTPGRHYSIAMVDIDYFKKLNDRHGHQVGDQALRMVAAQISRHTRGTVFRYGGEEFVIFIPGRNGIEKEILLEALREKIAHYPMCLRASGRLFNGSAGSSRGKEGTRQVRITVSIGVAHRHKSLKSSDGILKAADQALYKAKRNGRNCLRVHA